MLRRFLAWTDDDEPALRAAKVRATHVAIVLTTAVELTVYAVFRKVEGVVRADGTFHEAAPRLLDFFLPAGLLACLPFIAFDRHRRLAGATAAGLSLLNLITTLPSSANHVPVVTVALFFFALLDPHDPREQRLTLQALRWMIVIVVFGAGVQKVLYGHYFRGEFFAYRLAADADFAAPFKAFLPAGELDRLRALGGARDGAGPYISNWLPLVVASNLAYLGELATPVLLLIKRIRRIGVLLAILLFVTIEIGARELFFGVVSMHFLVLFLRADWNRRLIPVYGLFYVFALLVHADVILPDFDFS